MSKEAQKSANHNAGVEARGGSRGLAEPKTESALDPRETSNPRHPHEQATCQGRHEKFAQSKQREASVDASYGSSQQLQHGHCGQ